MECSEPGAIRDEELAAYSNGAAVRPEVLAHLSACQACSSQVAFYQRIDLQLTNKLYRWDCPSSEMLGEYQIGLLSSVQANEVRSHLSFCLRCTAEVATLAVFLANDPMLAEPVMVPQTIAVRPSNNHRQPVQEALRALDQWREQTVEGTRRIVAALLPSQPRLAFQREVAAQVPSWPRTYTAEDVSISVQVEQTANRRDTLQLIGFVKRSGFTLEALEGIPVLLLSSSGPVSTETIDELGNFVFPAVSPATYSLEMQFPEGLVVIEQLSILPQE